MPESDISEVGVGHPPHAVFASDRSQEEGRPPGCDPASVSSSISRASSIGCKRLTSGSRRVGPGGFSLRVRMPLPSAYTPCGKSNAAAHAGSRTLDGAKEFDRRGRAILVSGVALALRIIVQHADRRRIEIVELALSRCADEGEQSARCQQERERKHDRHHAYDRPPVG